MYREENLHLFVGMSRRRQNKNNARKVDLQDEASFGSLAKREVIPPEEFAGFDEFGEYPEFRPGDRAIEARERSDDKGRAKT
jgi:hypothetical protein